MNFGVNYVSPGIANYELPNNSAGFSGTINGLSNLLYGDSMGKNNPGFANLAGQDFHLAASSFCIDKAGAQAAATVGAYDVTSQYLDPGSSQARVTIGSAPDLGAFEYAPPGTAAPSLLNISTRAQVQNGESVLIGGFIVTGKAMKKVILRAIGPSLQSFGLAGVLADPVLELHGPAGFVTVTNDNWQDDPDQTTQIQASGLAPRNSLESAIIATLVPGAYTAIVSSKSGLPGIGLVEAYDLDPTAGAQLANISTRGFVQVADSVMIGGFTLGGAPDNARIAVRGLGPSLASSGLSNVLADPTLELHNANGTVMISNDDWTDDKASADLLTANGLALKDPKEAGIFTSLPSGPFTVILAGKSGGVGIGLVEIYNVK
jgi:hypothetical protein